MARMKWTVEIEVDECWVADGFEVTVERVLDMLQADLGYARESELGARILSAPSPARIAKAQGYASAAAREESLAFLRHGTQA